MNQWYPAPVWRDPTHRPPLQFGTAVPPPRPHKSVVGVLVTLVLVAAIVAGLAVLPQYLPVTSPGRSGNTGAPKPSPSSTPSSPPARSDIQRYLKQNPLYGKAVSGSCPAQVATGSRKVFEAQVRGLVPCLTAAYQPLLEELGYEYSPVKLRFFGSKIATPCGGSETGYAFYCAENETMYFSNQVFRNAEFHRLVTAETVIHEYLHHVQHLSRILGTAEDIWEGNPTERRVELQVFCWSYYTMANVDGFALDDDARSVFRAMWRETTDPEGHGSPQAQQLWGSRGLTGKDLGACNTWSASAKEVK